MVTERQNNTINILKGLLAVLVVAFHTSYGAGLRFQDGFEPFLRDLFCKFGGIAVPCFFFISGMLFFIKLNKWDREIWKDKLRKRIKSLFVPFVLWIAIAFVLRFAWGILKHELPEFSISAIKNYFISCGGLRMFYDRPYHLITDSSLGYIVDDSKPLIAPLWYVRDLIVLVLLSPVIWTILKKSRYYAVAILGLIYLLFIGFPFVLVSPTGLFFFSAGAAFSMSGKDFLESFRKFKLPSIILSLIFLVLAFAITNPIWNDLVYRLFVISTVVTIFNLTAGLYDAGRIKPIKLLTDSSFFIYASHAVLITEISNFLLWRTLPITAEWMLVLKVFLRPAVTVGMCLLIFVVMRKICPKILGLLTGGRF